MQIILTNCVPLMASDNLEHSLNAGKVFSFLCCILLSSPMTSPYRVVILFFEDEETVRKQVEMINSNLNMGVAVEKIVSDVDIRSSFQNSMTDVFSKVQYRCFTLVPIFLLSIRVMF